MLLCVGFQPEPIDITTHYRILRWFRRRGKHLPSPRGLGKDYAEAPTFGPAAWISPSTPSSNWRKLLANISASWAALRS